MHMIELEKILLSLRYYQIFIGGEVLHLQHKIGHYTPKKSIPVLKLGWLATPAALIVEKTSADLVFYKLILLREIF